MKFGLPADLTWYTLLYGWQTLIAGLIAILAAFIAYRGSVMQIEEIRRGILERKRAYSAIAALEAQRIDAEASRQQTDIINMNEEYIDVKYMLSRIEIRAVLKADWEQLGSLEPCAAFAIHHLIDTIEEFNALISPRDELFAHRAHSMLAEIRSNAETAARLLTNELKKD